MHISPHHRERGTPRRLANKILVECECNSCGYNQNVLVDKFAKSPRLPPCAVCESDTLFRTKQPHQVGKAQPVEALASGGPGFIESWDDAWREQQ